MNVKQVVPMFGVSDMEESLHYYGLELGGTALILQASQGVSLNFICEDAVAYYREVESRGMEASEPEVGNSMWVTGLTDPDGNRLFFESETDTPEDTKLSETRS